MKSDINSQVISTVKKIQRVNKRLHNLMRNVNEFNEMARNLQRTDYNNLVRKNARARISEEMARANACSRWSRAALAQYLYSY